MEQAAIDCSNIINLDDYSMWKHSPSLTVIKIFINYNLRFQLSHNPNSIKVSFHFIIINLCLKKYFQQLD